ncbi:histidine phosphatase family protein [Streptomyces sp. SID13031]|uniref:histidine phosphatase family protein n=1 Tax=Streptomyces sp. SID13031 TaxID=2706046 RepID=UPI0013CB5330|nr:histidine phosphatase family protein [Streptomyces sp. SID13031]
MQLIVVRHGQSTWNQDRRWAGQADPPLTQLGRDQAAELALSCRAAGIGAVLCSDLSRARETAAIVARTLQLGEPIESPDLRERWSRTLTGLTADEIEATFPGALSAWRDGSSTKLPGDSEAFDPFAVRVRRGLETAAGLAPVVLAVAHAGVLRALAELTGTPTEPRPANTTGRRFVLDAGRLRDNGPAFATP